MQYRPSLHRWFGFFILAVALFTGVFVIDRVVRTAVLLAASPASDQDSAPRPTHLAER